MKHMCLRGLTIVLLSLATIVVCVAALAPFAETQQAADANAKTSSAPAASATQESNKTGGQEPSAKAPAVGPGAGSGMGQQASPPSQGAETRTGQQPDKDKDKDKSPTDYSIKAVIIASLMVLVLGYLFFLQLQYTHRVDQTSYLGGVFRESVKNFEFNRYAAPDREKWEKGGYLREAATNEPPPSLSSLDSHVRDLDEKYGRNLWFARTRITSEVLGLSRGPTPPPGLGGLGGSRNPFDDETRPKKDDPEWVSYQKAVKDFGDTLEAWKEKITKEARTAYEADLAEDEKTADKHVNSAIETTDASLLRGQGPRFILEFTALIVIIFLAVVLGVLGVLKEEQIGTLLAAIAGYVLGKATTGQGGAVVGQPGGK